MRNNAFSDKGGAKKFLYTGPKKDNNEEDEVPWNFNSSPRGQKGTTGNLNGGSKFDMDEVWSIKRNVNIGGVGGREPKTDGLTYSTSKNYYSRHGGGAKDKDEFGASFGNTSNDTGSSQTDSKSWAMGNQSRRPFSYSFGTEPQNPVDKPVSPRNVSNSSAGTYTQTGNSNLFSQTGSGLNSGTNSNFNSYGGGRNVNSQGGDKMSSNNTSLFNKSLSPSSPIAGQSLNKSPNNINAMFKSSTQTKSSRNHLFNSKNDSAVNNRSPFNAPSSSKQDQSFW